MNYLKYDDCNEKNDNIINNCEELTSDEINQIINNLEYNKEEKMSSKLLKYIINVAKMRPITAEKVVGLTEKKYDNIKISDRPTAPSVFTNVVVDNILKLNKTETKLALSLICKLGIIFYELPKSRDVFYTKIRKPFLQKYGKDSPEYIQTLDLMKITKEERTKLNKEYKAKVKKSNKNVKTYYSKDLMDIIEKTKNNDDWATQAVGLILASGTRAVELLDKNNFKVDPKRKDNWIIVSNIAKKREGKKDFVTSRPIVGYTAREFIDAVADFRKSISNRKIYITEGTEKGQLNKSNTQLLGKRAKELFNDPEQTSKTLRKLYGNLSHALYGGDSNLNIFLGEVLGHDPEDFQTSFSYSTVKVVKGNAPKIEQEEEPKNPNIKMLTIEQKEKIVHDTIKKMVKNGEKISQDKVSQKSGISWRIIRPIVNSYKN